MLRSKFLLWLLLCTNLFCFSSLALAAPDVNLTTDGKVPGKPFDALQTQINDLQAQIDTIGNPPVVKRTRFHFAGVVVDFSPIFKTYKLLLDMGVFIKESADTTIKVTWTGAIHRECAYQVRIDGLADNGSSSLTDLASQGGAVRNGVGVGLRTATAFTWFEGLPDGPHTVSIYDAGLGSECGIGESNNGAPTSPAPTSINVFVEEVS